MKLGDPELFKINEIVKEIRTKAIDLHGQGHKDIVAIYVAMQEMILGIESELKEYNAQNQEGL